MDRPLSLVPRRPFGPRSVCQSQIKPSLRPVGILNAGGLVVVVAARCTKQSLSSLSTNAW